MIKDGRGHFFCRFLCLCGAWLLFFFFAPVEAVEFISPGEGKDGGFVQDVLDGLCRGLSAVVGDKYLFFAFVVEFHDAFQGLVADVAEEEGVVDDGGKGCEAEEGEVEDDEAFVGGAGAGVFRGLEGVASFGGEGEAGGFSFGTGIDGVIEAHHFIIDFVGDDLMGLFFFGRGFVMEVFQFFFGQHPPVIIVVFRLKVLDLPVEAAVAEEGFPGEDGRKSQGPLALFFPADGFIQEVQFRLEPFFFSAEFFFEDVREAAVEMFYFLKGGKGGAGEEMEEGAVVFFFCRVGVGDIDFEAGQVCHEEASSPSEAGEFAFDAGCFVGMGQGFFRGGPVSAEEEGVSFFSEAGQFFFIFCIVLFGDDGNGEEAFFGHGIGLFQGLFLLGAPRFQPGEGIVEAEEFFQGGNAVSGRFPGGGGKGPVGAVILFPVDAEEASCQFPEGGCF